MILPQGHMGLEALTSLKDGDQFCRPDRQAGTEPSEPRTDCPESIPSWRPKLRSREATAAAAMFPGRRRRSGCRETPVAGVVPACSAGGVRWSVGARANDRGGSRSQLFLHARTHTRAHGLTIEHTHTHTHTFKGPLSGTTRVSRYQNGKTNLDFTEARDSEWQWHQLGHMQVCT